MPIPFILAGAAVVAGAAGIKKGIDAVGKNNEANRIMDDSNSLLMESSYEIESNRIATNEALEKLGEGKVKLVKQLERYVEHINQIRNIDFEEIDLRTSDLSNKRILHEIKNYTFTMTNMLAGLTLSAGSGALVAFGAYSGAMALGTASTGVTISGLAGVASTNATLAYLGGGSLAAGGYGIAGGTLVLGGLVAGPAMAVGGFAFDSLATKKLENSKAGATKAKTAHKQQQLFATALENIQQVTTGFNALLLEVRKIQMRASKSLVYITKQKTDWGMFTQSEKEIVHTSILVAQLSKGMLEINILDEKGGLLSETIDKIKQLEKMTLDFQIEYS